MSKVVWHSAAATTSAPQERILTICAASPRANATRICGSKVGMTVSWNTNISVMKPVQCVESSLGSIPGSTTAASSSSPSSTSVPETSPKKRSVSRLPRSPREASVSDAVVERVSSSSFTSDTAECPEFARARPFPSIAPLFLASASASASASAWICAFSR